MESKESADIGGTGAEKDQESMPKSLKYHQNIIKMGPKIMENRGCVADPFLECFRADLGAKKAHRRCYGGKKLAETGDTGD